MYTYSNSITYFKIIPKVKFYLDIEWHISWQENGISPGSVKIGQISEVHIGIHLYLDVHSIEFTSIKEFLMS